jgi:citrate lyase subunit beta/citryl-CoA lyase
MRAPRTILAVPGSNPRMIEKGLASDADAVFLDLEDAVAPAEKPNARALVIDALLQGDWRGKSRTIRINPVDSPFCYRDVIDVLEAVGPKLDAIIVPKVPEPADMQAIDRLLTQVERAIGRETPVRLEAQIESARGLMHCEAIAGSSPRLTALVFGPGDFAGSIGMPAENLGVFDRWDEAYPGHRWHYAMSRIIIAARAHGLTAIDGPYADFRDDDGLRRSALNARALGYDGKWCIHPAQLETVASVFSPSTEEIARARAIVAALEGAAASGRGAVALGDQMLDAASISLARSTLDRARDAGLLDNE